MYQYCAHGFGYDSKANDYKFVRILCHCEDWLYKAEVYTLGTDSWRDIPFQVDEKVDLLYDQGVYLEGLFYWKCSKIVSFDMSEEKFCCIPLPDRDPDAVLTTLTVWNGSLVCFSRLGERDWHSMCYEMWVMANNNNDGNGGVTWTKHLTFGPLARVRRPLRFLNEEELLLEAGDGRIVSYNIRAETLKKLPIRGAILDGQTYADFYVETLVSLRSRRANAS